MLDRPFPSPTPSSRRPRPMPSGMRCGTAAEHGSQVTSDQFKTGLAEVCGPKLAVQRAELTTQIAEVAGEVAKLRTGSVRVRDQAPRWYRGGPYRCWARPNRKRPSTTHGGSRGK